MGGSRGIDTWLAIWLEVKRVAEKQLVTCRNKDSYGSGGSCSSWEGGYPSQGETTILAQQLLHHLRVWMEDMPVASTMPWGCVWGYFFRFTPMLDHPSL